MAAAEGGPRSGNAAHRRQDAPHGDRPFGVGLPINGTFGDGNPRDRRPNYDGTRIDEAHNGNSPCRSDFQASTALAQSRELDPVQVASNGTLLAAALPTQDPNPQQSTRVVHSGILHILAAPARSSESESKYPARVARHDSRTRSGPAPARLDDHDHQNPVQISHGNHHTRLPPATTPAPSREPDSEDFVQVSHGTYHTGRPTTAPAPASSREPDSENSVGIVHSGFSPAQTSRQAGDSVSKDLQVSRNGISRGITPPAQAGENVPENTAQVFHSGSHLTGAPHPQAGGPDSGSPVEIVCALGSKIPKTVHFRESLAARLPALRSTNRSSRIPVSQSRLADLNYSNARQDSLATPPEQGTAFAEFDSTVYPFLPVSKFLYGQSIIVDRRYSFNMTPRMEEWLTSVTAGLDIDEENRRTSDEICDTQDGSQQALVVGKGTGHDKAEKDEKKELVAQMDQLSIRKKRATIIGTKRGADDDDMEPLEVPKGKRARIGDSVRRAFSLRPGRRVFSRLSTIQGDGAADDATTVRAPTTSSRPLSRLSLFPRLGSRSVTPTPQRLKVCIIGDANSGKTAMIGRMTTGMFGGTKPTTATACRTVPVVATNGQMFLAELWDFPGSPSAGDLVRQQLTAAFFHAAVICYSVEDEGNAGAVAATWRPLLDRSLVECPIFVLGLKKDKRPDHPTVTLSFLPKTARASAALGQATARSVGAAGFGECSAVTGENLAEVWRTLADQVVARDEARRAARERGQHRDRVRSAVVGAGSLLADAFRGFAGH